MPDDDREELERALGDVEPLGDVPGGPLPRRRPPRRRATAPARRRIRFSVERWGESVEGLAEGADRRLPGRLRAGKLPPDERIDLHGDREQDAAARVRRRLEGAFRAGRRTVLVIHGRGLGSPDGPVLKEAVVEWLTAPPLAERVLAFATAPPKWGGPGALVVRLRGRRG